MENVKKQKKTIDAEIDRLEVTFEKNRREMLQLADENKRMSGRYGELLEDNHRQDPHLAGTDVEIGLKYNGFGKPTSAGRSSGRPFLILSVYLYYEQQVVCLEEANIMILPTMTYKEMYDHLAADNQKVEI